MAGHPQNLKPFPKGVSGNPGGRPKKITNALDRALTKSETQAIARAVIRTAKKGSVRAFEAIRDTIEGRPIAEQSNDSRSLFVEVLTESQMTRVAIASTALPDGRTE